MSTQVQKVNMVFSSLVLAAGIAVAGFFISQRCVSNIEPL